MRAVALIPRLPGWGGRTDLNKATATLPPEVAHATIVMHDPLPPPDSVEGYALVRRRPAGRQVRVSKGRACGRVRVKTVKRAQKERWREARVRRRA